MVNDIEKHLVQWFHIMTGASRLTYASIGIALLVAFLYFKLFFTDLSGFEEDAKNVGKLEWYSRFSPWTLLFRPNDSFDYRWSYLKIAIWLGISIGCGILAYYQLPHWFPGIF